MTQRDALDILKTGRNVYLTGPAGSGKTYVLNAYIDYLKEQGVEVGITASTGIAATHMGGVTIHSWTGLGIRDSLSEHDIEELEEKQYLWKRFEAAKVLIIDEVSMLHHFRLDLIERICRAFKRSDEPFGGMQVVLCGDFFQLPPVARMGEPDPRFIYHSEAWKNMDLFVCYLEEQWRQEEGDAVFEILSAMRRNDIDESVYEHLKSRFKAEFGRTVVPTKLYTHNIDVDAINAAQLEKITGEYRVYAMRSRGNPALVLTLKKSCLAPERLVLKVGTRVMFVKNNFEAGFVNGTLGEVVGFDDADMPIVKTASGETITAFEMSWGVEENGKIKAEIIQIPLHLAWAITVHKSQGMSLDAAEVDLSKSFVAGMGYVALSRVRSLSGLRLLGFNAQALDVNPEVLEFDWKLAEESRRSSAWLASLSSRDLQKLQDDFLVRIGGGKGKKKKEKLATHEATHLLLEEKLSLSELALRRGVTVETILSHLEKLKEKGAEMDIEYLRPPKMILERVRSAFEQAGDSKLSSAKAILGEKITYTEIKTARLFLSDR